MVTGWGTGTGDFSINLGCEEFLCEFPELTATMVDADGVEITGCLPLEDTYRVEVSLAGGEGNDSYTVTVGDSTKVMVSPETHIFGTYNAGSNTSVAVVGDQDSDCGADALIVSELCPPTNDDCASAQAIACGETLAGTNLSATPVEPGFIWCNTFASPVTGAVWYSITPETNAFITVGIDAQFDAQHQVFSGSCGELVCIDGSDFDDITFPAVADETYYVLVSGWGTSEGLFDITISCDVYPYGFPEITAIVVDDEGLEIDGCLDFGSTHRVEVTIEEGDCSDNYAVTVGDSTLVMVAGDTHIFGTYTVGDNVNVYVVGDLDTDCNVNTSVLVPICPAENDLCVNAFEAVCGGFYEGTTLGATADPAQAYCGTPAPNADNGGVWYSFSLGGDADVTIDLTGSLFDTKVFLYSGVCGELVCIDGDDDGGTGTQSLLTGSYTAGEYYIYVTGFASNRGTYVMNISCISLPCGPEVTATATDSEGNELTDCVDQTGEYYVLVSLTSAEVELNDFYNITINGDDFGQIAAAGSVVVGPIAATSIANVSVTGVDNNICSASDFTSVVICPPSNDMPCEAIPILTDGVGGIYTNINATADEGEPNPIFGDGQSVWFTFEGPASGRVSLSLCGENTTFDTGLGLYEVEDCGDYATYTQVAANDDNFAACGAGNASELETCVTPGVTYYVSVVGFGSNSGSFEIAATEVDGAVCLCDLPDFGDEIFTFADTAPVCDDSENPEFSLTFYSFEDMGSSTAFVYTYAWDGNGPFTIIVPEGAAPVTVPETFPFGTVIAVTVDIDDPNCTGAAESIYPLAGNVAQDEFACNEKCLPFLGNPCFVDEEETIPGTYNDNCECIPVTENDTCAGAIALECDADVVVGSNVFATSNIGCNGNERQTVWYTFTSVSDATVFMTTCHPETNFDTDISMYTGTCEEDLICFPGWGDAGYVDGNSGCELQAWASEGTFIAEAGVTYYIAVAGFYATGDAVNAWQGVFGLSLTCYGAPTILEGTVDGWPISCGDRDADVNLYTPDTDVLIGSFTGVVNADGNFTIVGVPIGTYDVIVKVDGTLAVGFADYEILVENNALALGAVQRGDINGDNGINIIDFSLINASFNSTDGDENYNPLADLNCSGGINILDVSIQSPNFLASGASAPLD